MSIAEKLTTIAENEQRIYDKGADDANIRFWNGFTNYGTRLIYGNCFKQANFTGITISNGLIFPSNANVALIFTGYAGEELPLGLDMSNAPIDNANAGKAWSYRMCNANVNLKYFYDIKLPALDYYSGTFNACEKLETIEIIRTRAKTEYNNAFDYCYALKNIAFEGVIGTDISFQYSPLTVESTKNIISHLADYSVENTHTYSVTFTDACWEALEASGKPYDDGLTEDATLTWKNYVISLGWNV